ncbi:MAG: hypothetical protein EOM68_13680, partial [Spirochaetia bacterium]|nr:hypothetical protein [Spirochaetia bacterium]
MFDLEGQICSWKAHLNATSAISNSDIEGMETHLRAIIADLSGQAISIEEAFLIAIRRLGDIGVNGTEFEKPSTKELWLPLFTPIQTPISQKIQRKELFVIIALALFGGLLSKIPALFGYGDFGTYDTLFLRNASLFAFTPVALYLLYKQGLPLNKTTMALAYFPLAALLVNLYPY